MASEPSGIVRRRPAERIGATARLKATARPVAGLHVGGGLEAAREDRVRVLLGFWKTLAGLG